MEKSKKKSSSKESSPKKKSSKESSPKKKSTLKESSPKSPKANKKSTKKSLKRAKSKSKDQKNEPNDLDLNNLPVEEQQPEEEILTFTPYPLFWNNNYKKIKEKLPEYDLVGPPSFLESLNHRNVEIFIVHSNIGRYNAEILMKDKEKKDLKNKKTTITDRKALFEGISKHKENLEFIESNEEKLKDLLMKSTTYFNDDPEELFTKLELGFYNAMNKNAKKDLVSERCEENLSKFQKELNVFLNEDLRGSKYINLRDKIGGLLYSFSQTIQQLNEIEDEDNEQQNSEDDDAEDEEN